MEITLFGFIWMIILFYCFINKNIKYMVYITLISMIWQCSNVLEIMGIGCGPQVITSFAFIIKSFFYKSKRERVIFSKDDKKIVLIYILLLFYIIINSLFINNAIFELKALLKLAVILIYIITFIRMYQLSFEVSIRDINKYVMNLICILLFIGFVQLVISFFNLPRFNIFQKIVYNDETSNSILYFKNVIRFYSSFMEPSYVAGILVGFLIYIINCNDIKKFKKCIIALLVASIILTFSSTAYVSLVFILAIYFFKRLKYKKTYLYLIFFLIILLFTGFATNILEDVIFNKMSSGSYVTRELWNTSAYKKFLSSPLFGCGYQSVRASSIFYDILAELGIVGLIIYIAPVIYIIKNIFSRNSTNITKSTSLIVLSMVISQLVACPDLDLCSFWLAMYIYALSIKKGNDLNEKDRNIDISSST